MLLYALSDPDVARPDLVGHLLPFRLHLAPVEAQGLLVHFLAIHHALDLLLQPAEHASPEGVIHPLEQRCGLVVVELDDIFVGRALPLAFDERPGVNGLFQVAVEYFAMVGHISAISTLRRGVAFTGGESPDQLCFAVWNLSEVGDGTAGRGSAGARCSRVCPFCLYDGPAFVLGLRLCCRPALCLFVPPLPWRCTWWLPPPPFVSRAARP